MISDNHDKQQSQHHLIDLIKIRKKINMEYINMIKNHDQFIIKNIDVYNKFQKKIEKKRY